MNKSHWLASSIVGLGMLAGCSSSTGPTHQNTAPIGSGQGVCDGPELTEDGDFEQGNNGSYESQYPYSTQLGGYGTYTIASDPYQASGGATWSATFGDHTTGSGLMFLGDGATTANVTVWQETVPVQPGTTYSWEFWAANADSDVGPGGAVAQLQTYINDQAVGDPLVLPIAGGQWVSLDANWTAGAETAATIALVNLDTSGTDNDFALDDVSFISCH